jgi:hypothetical protein
MGPHMSACGSLFRREEAKLMLLTLFEYSDLSNLFDDAVSCRAV